MAIKDDWAKGDKFTAADANTVAAAVNASVPNTRKVAGKALSADVTLTKSDVGLGNVDNTSDANKPISTATAAALANKVAGSVNGTPTGLTLWTGTDDQFDAIASKNANTLYTYPGGISLGALTISTTRTTTAKVTVDHTKVGAALTGFPLFINLAHMPAAWWRAATNGGGNIRCYVGGVMVPCEVVSCDPATKTGELHIKCDLSSTTDTVVTVSAEGASPTPRADSPYGARAVWSDYSVVSHDGGLTDTLGNVPNLSAWVQDPGSSPTTYTLTPNQFNPPQVGAGLLGVKGGSYFTAGDTGLRYEKTAKNISQISLWAKPLKNDGTRIIADLRAVNNVGQIDPLITSQPLPNQISAGGTGNYPTVDFLNGVKLSTVTPMTVNTWNYQVSQAIPNNPLIPLTLTLGQARSGAFYYDGLVDEIRLCDIARSPEWIAAEYVNQLTPATFYTVT